MIFSVENGNFGYRNQHTILNEINFSINPGETLAILGPNGAGKTTLLKCMTGLLKWKNGVSKIDGIPISKISHRELWKKIAYVPQAKNSAFSFRVLDMVLMGRSSHLGMVSQPKKKDIEIAYQAIEDLGMAHLTEKNCNQISGGELQMTLIARALASYPEMLILDEPESNLDFKNQLIILETMSKLTKEKGIACIFNTHYPSHALSVSTNALLLDKQGKSIFGPAEETINQDSMRNAFGVEVYISEINVDDKKYKSVLALSIAT